jgi:biopolymer transport protein ExbB
MNLHYLAELAASSGGTLYLMALLLLVALAVIVERSWFLYRVMAGGLQVNVRIASLPRLRADTLQQEIDRAGHLPHAALLTMALSHPELNQRDWLADRLEEAILHEIPKLDRSLWMLDTAVTLAPLLGLFGTIIGMFNAFAGLGQAGSVPTQVTSGVAEALIATASGLFIAMTGMVFLNSLNNRVRLLVHQLETLKQMVINRCADIGERGDGHDDQHGSVTKIALARTGS